MFLVPEGVRVRAPAPVSALLPPPVGSSCPRSRWCSPHPFLFQQAFTRGRDVRLLPGLSRVVDPFSAESLKRRWSEVKLDDSREMGDEVGVQVILK